jgi:hypothetical protein
VFAGTPPGAGKVRWVVLASQPRTDEIALVYSDHSAASGQWQLYTVTWNGSAFDPKTTHMLTDASGSAPGLGRSTQAFDVAYEDQSGDLLIIASNACCSCMTAVVRLAGTTTLDGPGNSACGHWTFQKLAAQRGGNGIVLAGDQGSAIIWAGSFFYPTAISWPGPASSGFVAWSDAAWVGSQPVAIAVQRGWPDTTPPGGRGNMYWLRSSTNGSWQQPAPVAVAGMEDLVRVQLEAFPAEDRVMAALADSANSLWVATYDMSGAWVVSNAKAPVVSKQLATSATRVFSIAIKQ